MDTKISLDVDNVVDSNKDVRTSSNAFGPCTNCRWTLRIPFSSTPAMSKGEARVRHADEAIN